MPLLAVDGGAALLATPALDTAQRHPLVVMAMLLAVVALNERASLYRPTAMPAVLDELPTVCARIVVTWCALAVLVAAFAPVHAQSALALALGCVTQSVACCAGRGAVYWRRRRDLVRRPSAALVIGPAATSQRVATAILRHPRCGVRPVGIVDRQPAGGAVLPVLTNGEEVQRALIQNGVEVALVVGPALVQHRTLLRALDDSGYPLWEIDADSPTYGMSSERLAGFSCRRRKVARGRLGGVGKRVLDIAVSGMLLLLLSPLLMLCAVVLRLTEGPGVVFRQERIGKDGQPFTLLKFRTHRPVDAHEAATRWSVANEQEMSRFCHCLRWTSLDELLQLWNVLWGDMSLVGPRPERPYFVDKFSQTYPGYAARHRMRTGITGLAQIHGLRGDTSIEDRCRFDNAYIDDWSLRQDICILLRTAAALVRPNGS